MECEESVARDDNTDESDDYENNSDASYIIENWCNNFVFIFTLLNFRQTHY